MELAAVKGKNITPTETKRQRERGHCMYCRDSRHFTASCPRKLKVASEQVEINLFNEDLGKGKNKEEESGKV
jgi:hypothetical protein